MGIRSRRELGQRRPFELRSGVAGHPPLRGVNKQNDPGAVPTWQFQHLENVEMKDTLVSRGGQTKVNGSAMDGSVLGFFSTEDDIPGGGWNGGTLAILTGESGNTSEVWFFNEEQNNYSYVHTTVADDLYTPEGFSSCCLRASDGEPAKELWLCGAAAQDGNRIKMMVPSYTAGYPNYPGTVFIITDATVTNSVGPCSILHDPYNPGTFYVGHCNVLDNTKVAIWKWDGTTLSVEDASHITNGAPVLKYGDTAGEIWAAYSNFRDNGPSTIRRRAPSGTWATLATSGFGGLPFSLNVFSQDRNGVKWVGGSKGTPVVTAAEDAILCSLSSTTITLGRTISNASVPLRIAGNAMVYSVANRMMYYAYSSFQSGTKVCVLGQYDGSTFTDSLKDFGAQFTTAVGCRGLTVHVGRLYALLQTTTANEYLLVSADLNSLSGSWTNHNSNFPSGFTKLPATNVYVPLQAAVSGGAAGDGPFDGGVNLISLTQ